MPPCIAPSGPVATTSRSRPGMATSACPSASSSRASCGALCGAEALLRWQHPQRGMVAPGDFIPLAEETGLIVPLGGWVLREACRQCRTWQDRSLPVLRVAVNLSAAQFRQKALLDSVRDALSASGIAPECLEVEITESMVMHNAVEAAYVLEALSVMGAHVSIDDFGTGYSSLS